MIPSAATELPTPPQTPRPRADAKPMQPRTLRPSERRFILLVHDIVAVTTGVLLSLWTWTITAGTPISFGFVADHAEWLLAIPLWILVLGPSRHPQRAFDLSLTAAAILNASLALGVVYLLVFFYAGRDALPRLMAMYVFWNCAVLAFGGRVFARWFLTRASFARRVLVAGEPESIMATLKLMTASRFLDSEVVGVAGPMRQATVEGVPVVGTLETIDAAATDVAATDIVVAVRGELSEAVVQRLLRSHEDGKDIVTLTQLYERILQRLPVHHLGPGLVVSNFLAGVPAHDASPFAKRLVDVIVALPLAMLALIVAPVVALATVIESGLPIFYRQTRLGRGGRVFVLTKFRTMKQDAERDGVRWSQAADPRVTRVGKFLRRTRLDELPNVWAVLRGDLSMVGPRPERPELVAWLDPQIPLYRARLTATPGLTGWAQVNHKYGDSVEDAVVKLEYDLYYIKHQSIWFDVMILSRTVWTILRMQGQ